MKTIECVVCGEHIVPKSDVDAAEHIVLKHPEVKSKILTRHLFREVEESDE